MGYPGVSNLYPNALESLLSVFVCFLFPSYLQERRKALFTELEYAVELCNYLFSMKTNYLYLPYFF